MSDLFSFAPLDFMAFGLDTDPNPYDISTGLSDDITMIPTESAAPMSMKNSGGSIMDRIAQTLAGDRYYGVSPEDKDRALSEALMAMGGRLGAAAGAGSWTKAQPYLNQLLSTGYGTFNQSMDESEKHRMAVQDRVDQLKLRELQMKKAEYEAGSLDRDEQAKLALRESAAKNAAEWQASFDSVINDTDILDVDRKMFKQNFNFALQDYMSRPDDPNAINRVLDYVNKVGEAAGQTEKIDQKVGQQLFEKWKTEAPGVPIEQYIEDQKKSYGLKLKTEQETYALLQARTASEKAQANQNNAYARYLDAGKPGSGSDGGVTETKVYSTVIGALNELSKDTTFEFSFSELLDSNLNDRDLADKLKGSPQLFSRIASLLPTNQAGQVVINRGSLEEIRRVIFDPMARESFAARYANQGLKPAPGLSGIKVAGVDAVSDPKTSLRVQKLLDHAMKEKKMKPDGTPYTRADALREIQSAPPAVLQEIDRRYGI